MFLLRLLYKPFAIIGAIIAGKLGQSIFRTIWAKIDEEPPPRPGSGEGSTLKVVGAQALQAGVMAGSAGVGHRPLAGLFPPAEGFRPKKAPAPVRAGRRGLGRDGHVPGREALSRPVGHR